MSHNSFSFIIKTKAGKLQARESSDTLRGLPYVRIQGQMLARSDIDFCPYIFCFCTECSVSSETIIHFITLDCLICAVHC